MKKFKFSMQSILNVNNTLKEAAQMELVTAQGILAEEKKKLVKLEEIILDAMLPKHINKNSSGLYFLQREKYFKKLKDDRLTQKNLVIAAEESVENSLQKLIEASVEVKKMEKAKERQFSIWRRDFNREEQKANDEIATTISFFNNKELIGIEE